MSVDITYVAGFGGTSGAENIAISAASRLMLTQRVFANRPLALSRRRSPLVREQREVSGSPHRRRSFSPDTRRPWARCG